MPSYNNVGNQIPQQTTQVYTNIPDDDDVEIDIGEILGVIIHYLWLIILVALVFGTMAYAYSKFVIPEEFESTTKIYVLDTGSSNSNQSTYTDLQVGSQLTKDYAQIITSRTVLEAVIAENNLQDVYKYDDFLEKVSVSTPTDTRVVAITVTDHDPALAQKMADDVRIAASQLILDTMQIDAVNTLEVANFPEEKSAPSCSKWALIGAMIGALMVAAVVVIRYILDDTIKTSDDVDRYLQLSTLALIPLDENVGEENEKGKKKKKKSKEQTKNMPSETTTTSVQPVSTPSDPSSDNRPQRPQRPTAVTSNKADSMARQDSATSSRTDREPRSNSAAGGRIDRISRPNLTAASKTDRTPRPDSAAGSRTDRMPRPNSAVSSTTGRIPKSNVASSNDRPDHSEQKKDVKEVSGNIISFGDDVTIFDVDDLDKKGDQ